MNPATERGFTLIEMTIVLALAFPILTGLAMTTTSVNQSIEANSRAADVNTFSRRALLRIANLIRPAQMSTFRVLSVALDVTELRATKVGEWIVPSDLVERPGLEFRSASGLLSMNAALTTSERRTVFVRDPTESPNGVDDDGDGLVDEGRVMLLQNGVTLNILQNVEDLTFELDGRLLTIRMRVARRATNGRIHRFSTTSQFYLRNN
jgi:hypothetical protein